MNLDWRQAFGRLASGGYWPVLGEVKTGNLAAAFFCVAALLVNHSIFRLGAMSPVWVVTVIGIVVVIALTIPHV